MNTSASPQLRLYCLFAVFFCSGFAGLIYESIWTHYLKLFLGHAAYAQTLVLSIFMLGMAIGSWIAGRLCLKTRRLFLIYAAVELILGVFAISFHQVSLFVTAFFFDTLAPSLSSGLAVHWVKWCLAALLIVPQSILIGMTFPLIANGLLNLHAQATGRTLAMLYFTNSLGASVGVLVSGFVLIAWVGLPGTTLLSGCINILIACVVATLFFRERYQTMPPTPQTSRYSRHAKLLFFIVTLTGLASFIYEIVWIRMLSLVLGSATHSFELMLSSFILGLALGGFFIRNRIDRLTHPVRTLAFIQMLMGAAAVASLLLYEYLFDVMQFTNSMLALNIQGYLGFNLISHLLCLLMMLPATICAGMTLPIITQLLIKEAGEQSVGNAYALNTLGSIMGVLLTVHIFLPLLGLKNSLLVGALLDIALGIILLKVTRSYASRFSFVVMNVTIVVVFVGLFPQQLDLHKLISGVFRYGAINYGNEVLFYRDGKTASVSVYQYQNNRVLATNGKPDASMDTGNRLSRDEATQILLGAIPTLLAPNTQKVGVIGFGSGMSTHAILGSKQVQQVDTIEIEPAMVEGAKWFKSKAFRAFDDPRSHIIIEDAKTYFAAAPYRYGLIMAEPSNPWVSGVSSLFSTEFYHNIKRYLTDDGIFAQWVQTYELSPELLANIGQALSANFAYYDFYIASNHNVLIVASERPILKPSLLAELSGDMKTTLATIGVTSSREIAAMYIASKTQLTPIFSRLSPQVNSDYFPIVDHQAVKSRFLKEESMGVIDLLHSGLPLNGTLLNERSYVTDETHAEVLHGTEVRNAQNFFQNQVYGQTKSISSLAYSVFNTTYSHCDSAGQTIFWNKFGAIQHHLASHLSLEQHRQLWPSFAKHACLQSAQYDAHSANVLAIRLAEAMFNQRYDVLQTTANALLQREQDIYTKPYLQRIWLFATVMRQDNQAKPPFELTKLLDKDSNKNWVNHLLLHHYEQVLKMPAKPNVALMQ